jgi:hypothetical protein
MRERPENEAGDRIRRRLNTRSVIVLLGIIAVASAIGIVVSFGQRSPARISDPAPTSFAGQPITPSPVPLEPQSGDGFSVADDLATHQIVLFGGVGNYANTWLWDGSKWTLAHPQTSPEGRFGASEAYDPQTKTVLLFGGRLEPGTPVHDTWAWNGTAWLDLDSGAGGPQPGEGSDMAWDPAHKQMVLLTRSGVISNPARTWVWSGTHWTQPAGSALPAGASYSPMWFDPVTRSLLAVGCCVGPPPSTGAANTTWRWNGASWTLLPTPANPAVNGSTMALDPAIGRLVVCACGTPPVRGSALFAWDGSDWTALPAGAPPVEGGTAITDYDRHQLLLFGIPRSATLPVHSPVQVWWLTGSAWGRLGPAG